ncbi:hypothetical protein [Streptomyces sp. C36]|uniref:hypothetical protein n=1 Tax=Streptomyces sp. C36 TaxID=3237122 RepID=UPI0034C63D08
MKASPTPERLLAHADAALRSAMAAATARTPPRLAKAAAGAAYLDLWACERLLRADGGIRSASARFLVPRLLMESVDGLTVLLGTELHRASRASAEYRRRARLLGEAMWHPDHEERLMAVVERLSLPLYGDDRLSRPMTSVRPMSLPTALHRMLDDLERERRQLIDDCALSEGSPTARDWARADRYALLTAAAACVDDWERRKGHRQHRLADLTRLVGALSRLAVRLDREPAGPDAELSGALFDEADLYCRTSSVVVRTARSAARQLVGV